MAAPNPLNAFGIPHGLHISSVMLTVSGLEVWVYGLDELPPSAAKVSCLWLHHPRAYNKESMEPIAAQVLSAYNQEQSPDSTRGLIAVSFDQRNHGTRGVDLLAGEDWRHGNKRHAQDMFGTITGTVSDTINLLDLLPAHLFGAGHGPGAMDDGGSRIIDHNLILGVSLGGHSAWQVLFADPRVTAGVIAVGCPDFMRLMGERARTSKLPTWNPLDDGESFFGSIDFPDALIAACDKYDPRSIVMPNQPRPDRQNERDVLASRIAGKRFLVLSGGEDKAVPYPANAHFLDYLKTAASTWFADGNVYIKDNLYVNSGHVFSARMRIDAVRFILESIALEDYE